MTAQFTIHTIADRDAWNNALRELPYAHVLQTWEWGEFKRATTGWLPNRFAFKRGETIVALASVGVRSVGPFKLVYVPKGPAMDYDDPKVTSFVLDSLQRYARRNLAAWLKIDPDVIMATGVPGEADDQQTHTGIATRNVLKYRGWRESADQVQFRNTITVDLTLTEDELLAGMSQNTRRKVRTGEKKGVTVRAATEADLPLLYDLYATTGKRDGFLTRPAEYYEQAWRDFMRAGLAYALIAEAGSTAIAQVILFHFGRKCWYFYGASSNEKRDLMPNYALQWAAIRWAKAQGYTTYDLWGAPDVFNDSDRLWGVYEFKRGFRGVVTRHIGAWDFAPYPPLYGLYTSLIPAVRGWMRSRSETETEHNGQPKPDEPDVAASNTE